MRTMKFLPCEIDNNWKYKDYMHGIKSGPVGMMAKFKGKMPSREMVDKDSNDYTQTLSISPVSFLNEAARATLDIIEREVMNYYALERFLPEEKKEIEQMLRDMIGSLTIPGIFSLYVTGITLEIPAEFKKKYQFKEDLKIKSIPSTPEYERYQLFLRKLINLNYIKP